MSAVRASFGMDRANTDFKFLGTEGKMPRMRGKNKLAVSGGGDGGRVGDDDGALGFRRRLFYPAEFGGRSLGELVLGISDFMDFNFLLNDSGGGHRYQMANYS